MWNCPNCNESIEDKYRHCWNCGKPKPEERTDLGAESRPVTKDNVDQKPIPVKHPVSMGLKLPEIERPRKVSESITAEPSGGGTEQIKNEITKVNESGEKVEESYSVDPVALVGNSKYESDFLSGYQSDPIERRSGRSLGFLLILGWCLLTSASAYFAYLSFQKMQLFSKTIELQKQQINSQKQLFVFPGRPILKKGAVIDPLPLKVKVLPLNVQNNEIEDLFSDLPDDLRPTDVDDVKTLMWFDCSNREVGRYPDGTKGLQEICQIYLVDRESSKFIAIREFAGIMPSLAKETDGPDSLGKVMPEKYIRFLTENQAGNTAIPAQFSADSPNHHFFSKSEFIYAVLAVVILLAIGFGWSVNKIRLSRKST